MTDNKYIKVSQKSLRELAILIKELENLFIALKETIRSLRTESLNMDIEWKGVKNE